MPSGGTIDATHAPGRGRELDSMRVEYSEPLAAWIFPRYARVICGTWGGWMCSYAFCLFLKKYRGRWKRQSHGNKITTNITGELHNDQYMAASTPHSTLYSRQESRSLHIFQRLPSDAVYSHHCG